MAESSCWTALPDISLHPSNQAHGIGGDATLDEHLRAVVGQTVASCGAADTLSGQPTTAAPSPSGPENVSSAGQASPTESGTSSPTASSGTNQEDRMKIQITIGDQRFQATLSDSAAGRDLIAQLPLTIEMADHGSVEKTGALPSPLSLDGQPDGADPDVGDVGYYAPGNDLVLYYGDQSYYSGIVLLGRLDGDAAKRIADLDGSVTATIESLAD